MVQNLIYFMNKTISAAFVISNYTKNCHIMWKLFFHFFFRRGLSKFDVVPNAVRTYLKTWRTEFKIGTCFRVLVFVIHLL